MAFSAEPIRVLVVDADILLAHNLSAALRSQGYDVRCVYSSETAAAFAGEFSPQVMICEIAMPGMSGIALANEFAKSRADCKVLLISGRESVIEVMEDPTPGGALKFLPKPLELSAVFDFLDACKPGARVAANPKPS